MITKATFELKIMIKKQGLKPKFKSFARGGWGGWIRTNECRHQKPMPYHLATPQHKTLLIAYKQELSICQKNINASIF